MTISKRSEQVRQTLVEFERKAQCLADFDPEYQEAAAVVLYTLSRVLPEKRHDRFYESIKLVLRALDKFPKPSIGIIRQECLGLCDLLDETGQEFLAFQKRFR